MNFFKLYIGDYQRDTADLSLMEHGAYLLMLQHYYATERPLPEGKALHRMLRATDKEERDAIDVVVQRFWQRTDAGITHGRADEEIRKAEHQRTVNREIGKRGGRPKQTQSLTESVYFSETDSVSDSHSEQEPTDNPNQTPDTRSPPSLRSGGGARATRLPPNWEPDGEGWVWAVNELGSGERMGRELAKFRDYWVAKPGKDGTKLDWAATWRNWVRKAGEDAQSRGSSGASRESAVDRVRRANASALADDGEILGAHGRDVRPQMDEQLRGDADGVVVEGAFRTVG